MSGSKLLTSSKVKILEALLGEKKSVKELAQILGINKNAIRKHLEFLLQKGLVTHSFQVKGVGRPRKFYSITQEGRELFGTHYHTLLQIFLEKLEDKPDFEELLDYACESIFKIGDPNQSLKRGSAYTLIQLSNKLGFQSEVLTKAEGSFILSRNCPFFRVARSHPHAICEGLHTKMVKNWLNKEAELKDCMAYGDKYCLHLIKS
jgi:predicted ArsR family transcriptional regulator